MLLDHDWEKGDRARIKQGCEFAGSIIRVIGKAVYINQWWVPVIDPEDVDEPSFYKASCLELVD